MLDYIVDTLVNRGLKPDLNGTQIMLLESKIIALNVSQIESLRPESNPVKSCELNQIGKTESNLVKNLNCIKWGKPESNPVKNLEHNRFSKT